MSYTPEEIAEGNRRARELIAEVDADIARYREEREERLSRGDVPREWQLPQEPVRRALTEDECRKIVRDEITKAIEARKTYIRDEIAKALKSSEAAMIEGIGEGLAAERKRYREAHAILVTRMMAIEQRGITPDDGGTAILDLRVERDERRRRSGSAA